MMARITNGILTLTEAEAGSVADWMRYGATRRAQDGISEALTMLSEQLINQLSRDPFDGRRFVIEIEQTIRRC